MPEVLWLEINENAPPVKPYGNANYRSSMDAARSELRAVVLPLPITEEGQEVEEGDTFVVQHVPRAEGE